MGDLGVAVAEGGLADLEDLLIEGTINGSIEAEAHHLTVGPKGQVEAEIKAANVTISGRLAGNINAVGKVEITKEADFNGEIKARSISVEDGAYLKAVIELERDPAKKTVSAAKPEEKVAPKLEEKVAPKPEKEPFTLAGKGNKGN